MSVTTRVASLLLAVFLLSALFAVPLRAAEPAVLAAPPASAIPTDADEERADAPPDEEDGPPDEKDTPHEDDDIPAEEEAPVDGPPASAIPTDADEERADAPPDEEDGLPAEKDTPHEDDDIPAEEEAPVDGPAPPNEEPFAATLFVATPTNGARTASTAAELRALLAEDIGGVVELTSNIVLNGPDEAPFAATKPVIVRMGGYGITVSGGAFAEIFGPVRFEGTGSPSPLFRLVDGVLQTPGSVVISAVGDGAVALRIEEDGGLSSYAVPELHAEGAGATALSAAGDLWLTNMTVATAGAGCLAIDADGDVVLDYCSISGDIRAAGGVTLNASAVTRIPDGATVVARGAVWNYPDPGFGAFDAKVFGVHRVVGDDTPLPEALFFDLYNTDDPDDYILSLEWPVLWELGSADFDAPGKYTIRGAPQLPGHIRSLTGAEPADILLHVAESGKPHLTGASLFNMNNELLIHYLEPIEGADAITLHHSEDGETWRALEPWSLEHWETIHAEAGEQSSRVNSFGVDRLHYFRLEVEGGPMAGVSEVLSFYLNSEGLPTVGGDRDDDDRGRQDDPPLLGVIGPARDGEDNAETGQRASSNETSRGDGNHGDNNHSAGSDPVTFSGGASGGAVAAVPAWSAPLETEMLRPVMNAVPGVATSRSAPGSPEVAATEPEPAPENPGPLAEEPALSLDARALADQLQAYPQGLTVIAPGIKAVIPAALLRSVALADGEELSVILSRVAEDRFGVRILAGGRELKEYNGAPLSVHVQQRGALLNQPLAALRCEDAFGQHYPAIRFDGNNAVFELPFGGAYRVLVLAAAPATIALAASVETAPAQSPQTPERGGLPVALPLAALSGAAALPAMVRLRRRNTK